MRIGNRVPGDHFITRGVGESDVTVHAGSYHLALRQAGVEMCNIITYSSILPPGSAEVPLPARESFVHGSVLECIMAESSAERGVRATAGLVWGRLRDDEGNDVGGLVCEYNGSGEEAWVRPHLADMLDELHSNGYEHLELSDVRCEVVSVVPTKKYGTALVVMGFVGHTVRVSDE